MKNDRRRCGVSALVVLGLVACLAGVPRVRADSLPLPAVAETVGVPGFLEPLRTIRVASLEAGGIVERPVAEGDRVDAGAVLLQLDDAVLRASLAIAEHEAAATSDRDAAAAELAVRRRKLETLQRMAVDGHSGGEELARAQADHELGLARVRAAEERATAATLEVQRLQVQLARRTVVAPVDAVVSELPFEAGEAVSRPGETVAVLVQIDRLRATFHVPASAAASLRVKQSASVRVGDETIVGRIAMVAALTDAESGTVRVRVTLPNDEGQFRAGTACSLVLPEHLAAQPSAVPRR